MIATMDDCFRFDLPVEVIRAQARVSKIIIERGIPPRLLVLCTYLVSTTSLTRGGRVFLSRKKVAARLGTSERTIDRHFEELEDHGILQRMERDHGPGGFFYGTCVKWSAAVWDYLFCAPGRTRTEALNERHKDQTKTTSPVEFITPTPTSIVNPPQTQQNIGESIDSPVGSDATHTNHVVVACHAPKLADYTPVPIFNKSLFVNEDKDVTPKTISFPKDNKSRGELAFRIPAVIEPWAEKLKLLPKNISLLMATAKRTDTQNTKRRLQDLLDYVGGRVIKLGLVGDRACAYLYKCLASGENYSKTRFEAPDSPTHEDGEISAANALRAKLPLGQITEICGLNLVRDGNAVRRVDPKLGIVGPSHLLTREQMAVLAVRAGFVEKRFV